MDKMIFTAMSGAKQTAGRQNSVANNLANVNTDGFRAEISRSIAAQLPYEGTNIRSARALAFDATVGARFSEGPMIQTDNPLDVAVRGPGWLSVQTAQGEAYTRAGALSMDADGVLMAAGRAVLGNDGPITVPNNAQIAIESDGSISAIDPNNLRVTNVIGRLKLVNPDPAQLQRGEDGLFRLPDEVAAQADEAIRVVSGFRESSNVSMVDELVSMISLARQFEIQTKAIKTAEENDRSASRLLAS